MVWYVFVLCRYIFQILMRKAQNVVVLAEHDGSVTCLKLHDQTLISGSTDGTIRIWQIPPAPTKPDRIPPPIVISTKSVSCLDYRPTKDTIAAGFHDIGRVQLWRQQPSGWVASQTLSGHSHGIRVIA
jgi:pyrimidine and pyridine-specific 5'-nucleotidase